MPIGAVPRYSTQPQPSAEPASVEVFDLETGDLCNITVAGPLPPGWHAVMDRRCGPLGQVLYYNESTDELTAQLPTRSAAPAPMLVQQRTPVPAEIQQRSEKLGFLAGKRTLLEQMESVDRMQLAQRGRGYSRLEEEDDPGPAEGWGGFNAVVRAVKRAAMHPLSKREKMLTASAQRAQIQRYTDSQSLWQCIYCGGCLLCVGGLIVVFMALSEAVQIEA